MYSQTTYLLSASTEQAHKTKTNNFTKTETKVKIYNYF